MADDAKTKTYTENTYAGDGLTKRDYFAAAAIQAAASIGLSGLKSGEVADHVARTAYIIADAMLKERSR